LVNVAWLVVQKFFNTPYGEFLFLNFLDVNSMVKNLLIPLLVIFYLENLC